MIGSLGRRRTGIHHGHLRKQFVVDPVIEAKEADGHVRQEASCRVAPRGRSSKTARHKNGGAVQLVTPPPIALCSESGCVGLRHHVSQRRLRALQVEVGEPAPSLAQRRLDPRAGSRSAVRRTSGHRSTDEAILHRLARHDEIRFEAASFCQCCK
jgi:hypothetical protein